MHTQSSLMKRHFWASTLSAMGLLLAIPGHQLWGKVNVRGRDIVAAIQHGARYLLAHENRRTLWETNTIPTRAGYATPQIGGETALVTEVLLDVSQSLHMPELNIYTPKMKLAINYLVKLRPQSTYVASFQANAMALLPPKEKYRRVLMEDARYLLGTLHRDGAYHYRLAPHSPLNPNLPGKWDNSNTQYGILGIWACAHAGLEVPYGYWRLTAKHWRFCQYIDGAWNYWGYAGSSPPLSMPGKPASNFDRYEAFTPAGLASLFICDEYLFQRPTLSPRPDHSILRGLAWMHKNFNPEMKNLYAMYGYERVALASGIQTIGGHNWFQNFAKTLLANQLNDGSWKSYFKYNPDLDNYIGTAYALLVLVRGQNPVVINKLQYTKNFFGDWNARQRDVANFTSWLSSTFESPLNWQVVNIKSPLADWQDAPILFINGSHDPHFSKAEISKIRQYIQDGGLVFSSCNGASRQFKDAMIKYALQVVHGRYKVKTLPMTSYLYTMQPWFHAQRAPQFLALSNGIRYLWIISSRDTGAIWQSRQFSRRAFWEFPANFYFYATGKTPLTNRLKSLAIPPPTAAPAIDLTMAQIRYHGNWNPEPAAWPRMARIAASKFQTELTLKTTTTAQLSPNQYPFAHLMGTNVFNFTPEQIGAMKSYLNHGGILFAEAGGGSPTFTNSFQILAGKLFPGHPLKKIPLASSIYQGGFTGGVKINTVAYRKFYIARNGHKSQPDLLGIKFHGQWAIIFSPDDISSGLLGTNTWGISGYSPTSAQDLARNLILYAATHAPVDVSASETSGTAKHKSKHAKQPGGWP